MVERGFKVFLSYADEDRSRIDSLARALETRGLHVWYDTKARSGSRWLDTMKSALDESDVFVLFCTPAYVQSNWSNVEMGAATGRALTSPEAIVLPVLGKGMKPGALPPQLRHLHAIRSEHSSAAEVADAVVEALERRRGGAKAG